MDRTATVEPTTGFRSIECPLPPFFPWSGVGGAISTARSYSNWISISASASISVSNWISYWTSNWIAFETEIERHNTAELRHDSSPRFQPRITRRVSPGHSIGRFAPGSRARRKTPTLGRGSILFMGWAPKAQSALRAGFFSKTPNKQEQTTLAGERWPFDRRPRAFAPPGARGLRLAISRRDLATATPRSACERDRRGPWPLRRGASSPSARFPVRR